MDYQSVDPATGKRIETYPTAGTDQVRQALERTEAAWSVWRKTSLERRAAVLLAAAERLEALAPELGLLMAREMGKPVAEGEGEARKCAWACRYYAEHAPAFLAPQPRDSDGSEAFVRADPLGPVLAIMPWNFPFWQFFRFAAPALMAGNTILLKHAPNTPGCALRIEELLQQAGLDPYVVQNLFLTNDQAADVIAHPAVRGVTLTGSTRAGRQVAAQAGRHLKTMVMELGGSDAFIVCEDADVERAAEVGVASRCLNNGQSCIAAKRFLVHAAVYDRFRDALVGGMRARVMGDPTDPGVQLGPMARLDLRDELARQVGDSIEAGARPLCGGEIPGGQGFYYPATVLAEVPEGTPAADQELFGPVAVLVRVEDDAHALAVANATPYGLGASLWTGDRRRAEALIPEIESGSVFVNGLVKSDPRLPFGGVKDSGFGRELSREGLLEFVNLKTIWIA